MRHPGRLTTCPTTALVNTLPQLCWIASWPADHVRCRPRLVKLGNTIELLVLFIVKIALVRRVNKNGSSSANNDIVVRRWKLEMIVL
jgi:hypothetical protein